VDREVDMVKQAHKKGGVDLSAFHATQGRRIVLLSQLVILRRLGRGVQRFK
jgi:hypothetical protein